MKADLTRLTDRPDQYFRAVRMQQGRVQLDAEWNEQQDILNRRIETETLDTLGAGAAVPIDAAGFQLTGAGRNVAISAGRCYVQGLLCEAGAGLTVIAQPWLEREVSPVVPAGASSLGLPPANAVPLTDIQVYNNEGAAIAPPDGVYIGYVEAWLRHVTALEDPLLREVALGVPDTTTRDQLAWQVKLLRAGNVGAALTCTTDEPWDTFTQAPNGTLAARAEPSVPPKDPCLLTPEAGYRRLENQLYRVEIDDDGSASGKVRFKWSRDNGTIVTRVTRWLGDPAADQFEVASIGRDATLTITDGCWVEFFDDTNDLLSRPGTLVQVLKTAGNVVTVKLATKTGSLDPALFTSNPRVRRWDDWQEMAPAAANASAGWVDLEDGIQVKFTPGRYRTGDYWTLPARTATADVEWPHDPGGKPRFIAPQGILRAFARLAVLQCQGGVWTTLADCRRLFPALSELTNLYYVGGDGQEARPNPLAPANVPLPRPLEVAVFNGQFPVAGAQVRFAASNGALPNGALTQTVLTGADGVAAVAWSIAPTVASQTCTALLLQAGAPAAGKFNRIDFSAGLSIASGVAYDPAKCAGALAAGINNVQDALDALCQQSHGGGGCCMTVGEGGDFPTLDEAIRKLLERKERDLCLCLLPGEHKLGDGIKVKAPDGTHLHVHGAGLASRLIVREQPFMLVGFASVTFENFEVQWTQDWALLRLEACAIVRFTQMGFSGFVPQGRSMLQISAASRLEISGCRINGYAGEKLKDHLSNVFGALSLLKPMVDAFNVDSGNVFAPVPMKIAESYAGMDDNQRTKVRDQINGAIRASQTGQLSLGPQEVAGLQLLASDIQAKAGADVLVLTLDGWRTGVLLNQGGAALALLDTRADTLLADNSLNGSLILGGEISDPRMNLDFLKMLGGFMNNGKITLAAGSGLLRLRNNRLRGVRLGEVLVKRITGLFQTGGSLDGCYRSIVADANTSTVETAELLAIDASLSTTSFEINGDVGAVIATQGKYFANFAHNDFRLFAIGHKPEAFGNGALNIVPM